MANSIVINVLAKVGGVKDVETLKAKLTNLTTSKGFQSAVMGVGISAGQAAWSAVGSAVQGAGQWMSDAVGKASALAESMSKSNVVFGASAGAVEAFANTAATSFGLSKQAAIEASATFGNLLVGMGETEDAAAAMSIKVVGLAADLGSFNNVPVEEALGGDPLRARRRGRADAALRRVAQRSGGQGESRRARTGRGQGRTLRDGQGRRRATP